MEGKLQEFIDTAEVGTKIHIKDISLTDAELEEVYLILNGIENNFLKRISATEIVLLRIDPDNSPLK